MDTLRRRNWHEPFVFTDGRVYDVLNCCLLRVGAETEWRCVFEIIERRFQDFGELQIEYSREFCDREYLCCESLLPHARRVAFEFLLACDCRRGVSGAPFATILRCE